MCDLDHLATGLVLGRDTSSQGDTMQWTGQDVRMDGITKRTILLPQKLIDKNELITCGEIYSGKPVRWAYRQDMTKVMLKSA